MISILKKWQNLALKQRLMIITAAILGVLVAAQYIELPSSLLPLPHIISAKEEELIKQKAHYSKLQNKLRRIELTRQQLQRQVGPYLWRMEGKVPSAALQADLQKIARKAHVTIQTTGGQRTYDVSDHVRSVEAAVKLTGTMREISRFLEVCEKNANHIAWHSCRLRPIDRAQGVKVNLSGRVKAFFLATPAEKLVFINSRQNKENLPEKTP
ncbi:MAG: hypothetical protein R6V56_03730 [Lentisphaeria bacterium]